MLLSGNGRHRRPRPTSKFVVAAGVTGAGVAIPLMSATGAHAASADKWDKVADCESGNRWSANTGNGYFGGLQLSQDTWERFGGKDFAPRPDLASRSDQIAVAEQVLAGLGPTVWPSCSLLADLTEDDVLVDSPADEPVGVESPAADPAEADDEAAGSSSAPEVSASVSVPVSPYMDMDLDLDTEARKKRADDVPGERAPSPFLTAPSRSETPQREATGTVVVPDVGYVLEPEYEQLLTGPGTDARSGGTGSRSGQGKHRGAPEKYTVGFGDSLVGIAAEENLSGGWRSLYEENKNAIGADPNALVPGQKLRLP